MLDNGSCIIILIIYYEIGGMSDRLPKEVKGPMKAHACLINVQKHEHCEILLDLGWIGF